MVGHHPSINCLRVNLESRVIFEPKYTLRPTWNVVKVMGMLHDACYYAEMRHMNVCNFPVSWRTTRLVLVANLKCVLWAPTWENCQTRSALQSCGICQGRLVSHGSFSLVSLFSDKIVPSRPLLFIVPPSTSTYDVDLSIFGRKKSQIESHERATKVVSVRNTRKLSIHFNGFADLKHSKLLQEQKF